MDSPKIKMCMVLGFVYDVHGCGVLDINFTSKVDQCVLNVQDCRFVCMHEGS